MARTIGSVTFLVHDYDEAIDFFTRRLDFRLVEDTPLDGDKRWVRVAPNGSGGTALLLAKAATPEQAASIGRQSGGRVFLFLETGEFWSDYRSMQKRGVRFAEEPRQEPYGLVVIFFDLYGNKWDLVQYC